MKNENSVLKLIMRLLGVQIMVVLVTFFVFFNLINVEDNNLLGWTATIISSFFLYLSLWGRCSIAGNQDARADEVENKQLDDDEEIQSVKMFKPIKVVLASGIVMFIPFVLSIVLSITKNNKINAFLRIFFIPHIKPIAEEWGVNVNAVAVYAIIYILVCVLAYMGGKVQRKKTLETIKINDRKRNYKK